MRALETRITKLEAVNSEPKFTVLTLFGEETAEDAWAADHGDEPMPGGLIVLITCFTDLTREEYRMQEAVPPQGNARENGMRP